MSLTTQTTLELQDLAQAMVSDRVDAAPYRNFGTLVRKDSNQFEKFADEIIIGEIELDGEKFILFNK